MRPHEETWHLNSDGSLIQTPQGDTLAEFLFDGQERAKLAAQAPALARSLLQLLEWVVTDCREHGSDPNEFEDIKAAREALYYAGCTE